MHRITIRDVIWLLAMVLLAFAWFVDHWLLMNHLKSCRFGSSISDRPSTSLAAARPRLACSKNQKSPAASPPPRIMIARSGATAKFSFTKRHDPSPSSTLAPLG